MTFKRKTPVGLLLSPANLKKEKDLEQKRNKNKGLILDFQKDKTQSPSTFH